MNTMTAGWKMLIAHVLESGARERDWLFLYSPYAESLARSIGIETVAWRYHVAKLTPRPPISRAATYKPDHWRTVDVEGPNQAGVAAGREYTVLG